MDDELNGLPEIDFDPFADVSERIVKRINASSGDEFVRSHLAALILCADLVQTMRAAGLELSDKSLTGELKIAYDDMIAMHTALGMAGRYDGKA